MKIVKCEQCGKAAIVTVDEELGTNVVSCPICGKIKGRQPIIDENDDYCYDEDGNIMMEDVDNVGYGCMVFFKIDETCDALSLQTPADEEDIKFFFQTITTNSDVVMPLCKFFSYNQETKQLESIYGSIPDDFPEDMEYIELNDDEEECSCEHSCGDECQCGHCHEEQGA